MDNAPNKSAASSHPAESSSSDLPGPSNSSATLIRPHPAGDSESTSSAGPPNPSSSDPTPTTSRSDAVEDSDDGSSPPKKIVCRTPLKLSRNQPETPTTPLPPPINVRPEYQTPPKIPASPVFTVNTTNRNIIPSIVSFDL